MSNRTVATILGMMHGILVITSMSVMTVETTQFHLKARAATLRLTLWLVIHGVLKALILGLPCQTPKIAAVVPRRGSKKSSLNINLFHSPLLLKCLRSILLFLQR